MKPAIIWLILPSYSGSAASAFVEMLPPVWLLLHFVTTACSRNRTRKCANEFEVVDRLMRNYTKILPSRSGGEAVLVEIEMHVQDVSSLNELTSDFEIDILFSQLWLYGTLSFDNQPTCKTNITLESKHLKTVWTPNTVVINSKNPAIHSSPTENVMFILYQVRDPLTKVKRKKFILNWHHYK